MNLKEIRTKTGLTQEQFAKELCMSWRNYHRCESANKLTPQAEKILLLMIELKRLHGFINKKINCLEINVSAHHATPFKTKALFKELDNIESALGLFAGGAEDVNAD